ncbi:hypothetical protein EDB85DRAFT_501305 [Lactarius pseudohatsudake]|nr:hypothetical protein EDB85DRAFT_501305 [Lactarius pseudohatsudake]
MFAAYICFLFHPVTEWSHRASNLFLQLACFLNLPSVVCVRPTLSASEFLLISLFFSKVMFRAWQLAATMVSHFASLQVAYPYSYLGFPREHRVALVEGVAYVVRDPVRRHWGEMGHERKNAWH